MSNNRTEIKLEFVGTSGVNSFIAQTSSPRACMDASHMNSRVPLITPDEPTVKSGIEYELGKYINDVRTEHDCIVKAIIPKYKEYGVDTPPVYTVFVEYEENGKICIDYIDVDTYRSSHGFFGYHLNPTDDFLNLGYNSTITKDTILATTASHGKEGCYNYGLNANVAFMSHPSVAEDGFVVSESFIQRAKFTSIVKRVINITKDTIPVNLNGNTQDIFKFIPGIGEKVRPDGLLCVLRPRNDWFSVSDMNNSNISETDYTFDNCFYVNPNSTVIDISVTRGNYIKPEFTSKMTEQLDAYAEMLTNYYRNVVSKYEHLLNEKKVMYGTLDDVKFTPRLHRFITDCMIKVNMAGHGKNKLCYRKLPIDQYRIEVTTMSVIQPDLGYKLTGLHGDKGVICRILPDECMPVDELGNRADIITDSMSTISRMNLSRAYQSYMSALGRDNRQRVNLHFNTKYGLNYLNKITSEDLMWFKNYLHGLYSLISSDMVNFLNSLDETGLKNHLTEVVTDNLYIYYPPDNEKNVTDVITDAEKTPYKPHLGKVSYVDELGRRVTTKEDVRIGQLYILMLEKIANTYSGVSSAKVNNFGFPVKSTNLDKHKYPHSLTPTKTVSETEGRIIASMAEPEMISELFDLTLNTTSHKLLVKSILESDKAFDPTFNIDRDQNPYGNTRSLAIMKHMFTAAGFDYEHVPETTHHQV